MTKFDPTQHLIFEGLAGSKLYGTSTPESDHDTRGVCIPPKRVSLDPFENFDIADSFEGQDRAIYSLAKFFKLCADNNPNVLELLFVPEQFTFTSNWQWNEIVRNRHLFLSKNVKHRFLGYAISQLEAIKRHREWFVNPPDHKPTREEFGLDDVSLGTEDQMKALLSLPMKMFSEDYLPELYAEREYREAKRKWDNYEQWKKNRNPKRKGTEEQFGYDTKYASHLFRLMTEGKQLLLEGTITFPLQNAQELLAIKQGILRYEEVLELADGMAENFDQWYAESSLPMKPNVNALKDLYFRLLGV